MQTNPCVPCCDDDASPTQVPGPDGAAGQDGSDGVDAFTTTTSPTTVPAVGANVTVTVADSSMFAYGLFVVMGNTGASSGPATFQVVGIPTATSLTLTFKGYPADVAVGTVLASGSKVVAAGQWGLPTPLSVYGAGAVYNLTATSALLNLGTTPPSLTLTAAGTYQLRAKVRIDFAASTFTAVRTVSLKLRRTNNTAADIANATAAFKTPLSASALTYTAATPELQEVSYTTSNSTDIIQIWGSIDVVPGAGTIDAVEASIVAVRIF